MKLSKPHFTATEISYSRFYSGITIGVVMSIILNKLFRLFYIIPHLLGEMDQLHFSYLGSQAISTYYDYLIAFIAISLSFCFTTYIWTSNLRASSRNRTLRLRLAHANSIWMFFLIMMFFMRMYWFVISTYFSLERDIPYLAFLLPLVIYGFNWHLLSNVYRTKYYPSIALAVVGILMVLLVQFS